MEYKFDELTGNLLWRRDVLNAAQDIYIEDNQMKNRQKTSQLLCSKNYLLAVCKAILSLCKIEMITCEFTISNLLIRLYLHSYNGLSSKDRNN